MTNTRQHPQADAGKPLLLTVKEACQQLGGISSRKLWSLTTGGEIKSVRIGRRVMYRPSDLEAYIESLAG